MTNIDGMNNDFLLNYFKLSPTPSLILIPRSEKFIILEANIAYLSLIGVKVTEILGEEFIDTFNNNVIAENKYSMQASLQRVFTNKIADCSGVQPFKLHSDKDSEDYLVYWQIDNKPSFSKDGEVEYIIHTITDKTNEQIREIALKEAEQKANFHFENNPYPMIIWEFETLKILNVNENTLEKYGYTKEEFLALDITQIRPIEDIPLIKEATQDIEHYGMKHKRIWRHLKKNGELMYVEVNAHLTQMNGRTVSINHIQDVTEKFKAENELRDSEQKYEALFVSANDAIFLADAETRILTDANDKACQLLGRTREEVIGMHQSQLHASEDLEYISMQFARFVNDDTLKSVEVDIVHKDGYKIPVKISAGNTFHVNGRKFAAAYFTDLTQTKEAERLIEKTTRLLLKAEGIAKIGSVEVNTETMESLWSEGFKRIVGVDKDEVAFNIDEFFDIILPEDRQAYLDCQKRLMDGQAESTINEIRIKRVNDNKERIISINGIGVKNREGKTIKLFGVIRDITDRKQLEAEILHSHNQLKKLTNEVPLGILKLDSTGFEKPTVSFVSKGIERVHTGLTAESVMENANLLYERVHPDDIEMVITSSNNSISNMKDVDIEFRSIESDNHIKWIRLVYHPERNEDGTISQYGYCHDITKEKMMMQALTNQNKELREIAWIQSHILRAPVAKLMGLADLISRGLVTDNLDFFMESITATCNELDEVVREIVAKANKIEEEDNFI